MVNARPWFLTNSETVSQPVNPNPGNGKGPPPAGWTGRGRGGGWGKGGKTGSAVAPENTVAPTISGDTAVGSTLTTTDGTWTADPSPTFTYQWTRDNVDISGATSSTYVTVSADAGTAVRSKVTATNSEGSATETSSNSITVDTDIKIRAVRLPAPTHGTPTTQDFTVAGFGTPKAAIFIGNWSDTDDAGFSTMKSCFGATDGTNEWFSHAQSRHNLGVSGSTRKRVGNNTACVIFGGDTGTVSAQGSFNSFITDGVRLDWTYPGAKVSTGKFVTCILIGGSAVSAAAGLATLAGSGASTTLTPGFETNVGIFCSTTSTMDGTVTSNADSAVGFATNDGVTILQASRHWADEDAADPTNINNIVSSSGVLAKFSGAHVKVENITATQIDLTSVSATFTDWDNTGYLLLNIGSGTAWAGVLDSPTSTGVHSFEEPSILPIFGLVSLGMNQVVGTNETDADAQSFGWGAFTANEEYSTAGMAGDNQSVNSVTKSWASQSAVSFTNDGSAAAFVGAFDSFDSLGVNVNFPATVDGTVRKWPSLFIGRG